MKAGNRLLEKLGDNIGQSVAVGAVPRAAVPATAGGAGDVSRHAGMNRVKAFKIPLDQIAADPDQPRKEFDPDVIARLARSLAEHGQLQPCRVRWDGAARVFVLVAGEQRFRAAALAGLPTLDCVEAAGDLTPDAVLDQQLIENCLRDDLKPVEQAAAFRRIMDHKGWTAHQVAGHLNLPNMQVYRALDLLKLPDPVRRRVDAGDLAPSTAVLLAKVGDPAAVTAMAEEAVAAGMTAAEVTEGIRAFRRAGSRGPRAPRPRKPDPLAVDVGDAVVTVRWKGPSSTSGAACLRAALKTLQGPGRAGGGGKNPGDVSEPD